MRRDLLFRCNCCETLVTERAIVSIYVDHPKPGRDRVRVSQCPECGECEQFTNMCDEPGCHAEASSGWPTTNGDYRRTCGVHWRERENERAK